MPDRLVEDDEKASQPVVTDSFKEPRKFFLADEGDEKDLTPLEIAARRMMDILPAHLLHRLKMAVHQFCDDPTLNSNAVKLTIGNGCAGTDMMVVVCKALSDACRARFKFGLQSEHVFSCEHNPDKQHWIHDQFPELQKIFAEMADLKNTTAHNVVTGKKEVVPHARFFSAGFVCKILSGFNMKTRQKSPIQNKAGTITDITYEDSKSYLKKTRPLFFLLENVPNIEKIDVEVELSVSDADFICSDLGDAGFTVVYYTVNAQQHGSMVVRNRTYFFGYDGMYDRGMLHARITKVLDSLHIESLPKELFIAVGPEQLKALTALTSHQSDGGHRPASRSNEGRDDLKYKDDHAAAYEQENIQWPPNLAEHGQKYVDAVRTCTDREKEVTFLLIYKLKKFLDVPNATCVKGYADINQSLGFIVSSFREDEVNVLMKEHMRTITGQTKYFDFEELRLLSGIELLGLMGWPVGKTKGPSLEELHSVIYML